MKTGAWIGSASAVASAALLWLGLPGGGGLWPLLPVALVPLLHIFKYDSASTRFFWGLAAGFLHFMLQIYWIVIVLGRYGGLEWFFSYPALVLLCLYMAVYVALFVAVGGALYRRCRPGTVLWLLPLLWVGLDWCRAVFFSGFPWMDLGYGFWQTPLLIQSADLFGHYFLTFLVLLCNCLVFLFLQKPARCLTFLHLPLVLASLLFVVVYGHIRGSGLQARISEAETMTIGVVQGNIDQSRKWSPDQQQRTVDIYLDRSADLLRRSGKPALIVWPETALPFFPQRNPLIHSLQRLALQESVAVLTGSPWFEAQQHGDGVYYYNAAFVVDEQGEVRSRYFKSHLVPFGEYVPLKDLLFFLAPLVEAVGDFSPGTIEAPLRAGEAEAGVLICFESIFPGIAREWVNTGANLLINLTNDAWYGRTSAPQQSMAMTVFRAVETRRSLVRAANTGISGFVDPLGHVLKSSSLFIDWAASAEVPLFESVSFHSRYGYLFGPLCALAALVMVSVLLLPLPGSGLRDSER